MLIIKGYPLANVWEPWVLNGFDFGSYFKSENFIPTFFVTVACGIMSGFHSTQITIITRTMESEREGRHTIFNMMIAEGFIAMVWAAATMAMIGVGAENSGITVQLTEKGWTYFANVAGQLQQISATSVVGVVCRNMLGPIGGVIAIIGVIILPISTGDTALRSLRITIADALKADQSNNRKRLLLATPIFVVACLVLVWAKINPQGFNTIWRYFGWSNQTLAVFALASIALWFIRNNRKKYLWIPMVPLLFYSFVISSYITHADIGISLPRTVSLVIGGIFTAAVASIMINAMKRSEKEV